MPTPKNSSIMPLSAVGSIHATTPAEKLKSQFVAVPTWEPSK